jgi:ATP synthase I chain
MTAEVQPDAAEQFFSGALDRIRRFTLIIGGVSTVVVWAIYGTAVALGYLIGCFISYVNFHWLKKAIEALAARVTQSGYAASPRGIIIRFILRYGFIVIACYAILMGSKSSVFGLLGGLFVTVAAILCEAAYEVATSLRQGI